MGKYEDLVENRLDEVKEWASAGATNLDIANRLNISEKTFYSYCTQHSIFRLTILEGRKSVVSEIRAAMFKRAMGFNYTETKRTTKQQGDEKIVTVEETEKYQAPSETAASMLLRLYDKDYIDRDQTSIGLKEREVNLKEKIAESNYFFNEECAEMTNDDGENQQKDER